MVNEAFEEFEKHKWFVNADLRVCVLKSQHKYMFLLKIANYFKYILYISIIYSKQEIVVCASEIYL